MLERAFFHTSTSRRVEREGKRRCQYGTQKRLLYRCQRIALSYFETRHLQLWQACCLALHVMHQEMASSLVMLHMNLPLHTRCVPVAAVNQTQSPNGALKNAPALQQLLDTSSAAADGKQG